MTTLLVRDGTTTNKISQAQITFVENGVILSRVYVVNEAGRPPYQTQTSYVFHTLEDALKELRSDV